VDNLQIHFTTEFEGWYANLEQPRNIVIPSIKQRKSSVKEMRGQESGSYLAANPPSEENHAEYYEIQVVDLRTKDVMPRKTAPL